MGIAILTLSLRSSPYVIRYLNRLGQLAWEGVFIDWGRLYAISVSIHYCEWICYNIEHLICIHSIFDFSLDIIISGDLTVIPSPVGEIEFLFLGIDSVWQKYFCRIPNVSYDSLTHLNVIFRDASVPASPIGTCISEMQTFLWAPSSGPENTLTRNARMRLLRTQMCLHVVFNEKGVHLQNINEAHFINLEHKI